MGGSNFRPLPKPSYRPPPVDRAVEARTVRRTLRDANTRRGDQLLDYALVRAGFIPGLDDYLHPVNPYLGQGEKSPGTFAMSLLTTLAFVGAAGLALEIAKPSQPVKAHGEDYKDYTSEELAREPDDEIKSLQVSPTGKTVVYTKLAEPPVSGQTEKIQIKQVDVRTKQKGSIDAGPLDRGSAFDSSGKPVYVKTTDSFHSELRVKGNGSGPDKVLDSCDDCQIHSPQNGGGDIFFGKLTEDTDGNVKSEILVKRGSEAPALVKEIDSEVFRVNEDGTKLAVSEQSGTLSVTDLERDDKVQFLDRARAYPLFGYGKLLIVEREGAGMLLSVVNSDGHGETQIIRIPGGMRDIEWKSPTELSYLDENGTLFRIPINGSSCAEMLVDGLDAKDHAWSGDDLFQTDGMAINKLTSSRFGRPISCAPPLKRFQLPFYDTFDGPKFNPEWRTKYDVALDNGRMRNKGLAVIGSDKLVDYLFSAEFLDSSLPPGKSFLLAFGRHDKSLTPEDTPGFAVPAQVIEFKRSSDRTLSVDMKPTYPYLVFERLGFTSPPNATLAEKVSHQIGLAVSSDSSARVYVDGKQIYKNDQVFGSLSFQDPKTKETLKIEGRHAEGRIIISSADVSMDGAPTNGNVADERIGKSTGVLFDNVAIEPWRDRPLVVGQMPSVLTLREKQETRLILPVSDPDDDKFFTGVYEVGRPSFNARKVDIRKVSEVEYAIKPLSRSPFLLRVEVNDEPSYGNRLAEHSIPVQVINGTNATKAPAQKPTGLTSLQTLLLGGGAAGAVAAGVYANRRRKRASPPVS